MVKIVVVLDSYDFFKQLFSNLYFFFYIKVVSRMGPDIVWLTSGKMAVDGWKSGGGGASLLRFGLRLVWSIWA